MLEKSRTGHRWRYTTGLSLLTCQTLHFPPCLYPVLFLAQTARHLQPTVLVPWNTETLVNPHTLCISRHSRFPANVQNVLLPLDKTCRWKKGHIWREISYLEQGGILLLDLTEKCPADIEQYHLRAHLWKSFDKMMIWHKTLSQSEVQEKVTSGCYCEKA